MFVLPPSTACGPNEKRWWAAALVALQWLCQSHSHCQCRCRHQQSSHTHGQGTQSGPTIPPMQRSAVGNPESARRSSTGTSPTSSVNGRPPSRHWPDRPVITKETQTICKYMHFLEYRDIACKLPRSCCCLDIGTRFFAKDFRNVFWRCGVCRTSPVVTRAPSVTACCDQTCLSGRSLKNYSATTRENTCRENVRDHQT